MINFIRFLIFTLRDPGLYYHSLRKLLFNGKSLANARDGFATIEKKFTAAFLSLSLNLLE